MAAPETNFKNVLWDPMPKQIFNELNTIDTELSWELCRADIVSQLLGHEAFGIPFLDESHLFEPFAVCGKVKVRGKKYLKYFGRLPDLICPCQHPTQFYQTPKRVDDNEITQGSGPICQDFVYRVSNKKDCIKKGIKVRLTGLKCYDVQMTMNVGDLRLDFEKFPHLKGVQKLFVIYQTFYTETMSVSVTIGESRLRGKFLETENKKFCHEKRMPIAFSVDKFPVNRDGVIGKKVDTSNDSLREAPWKRSGVSAMPDVPQSNRPELVSAALRGAVPMSGGGKNDMPEEDDEDY